MHANTAHIYSKTIDVIQSCNTLNQLDVAIRFANQATAIMRKRRVHHTLREKLESNIAYQIEAMGINLYLNNKQGDDHGYELDQRVRTA